MEPRPVQTVADAIRGRKIALVLAGGGLKGSYQIGVWKALREQRVEHFHVISGTSVGALNSVLVANGNYQAAEDIWLKQDIVRFGPQGALWFVAAYAFLFGPAIASLVAFVNGAAHLIATGNSDQWGISLGLAFVSFISALAIRVAVLDGPLFFQLDSITVQLWLMMPFPIVLMLGGLLAFIFAPPQVYAPSGRQESLLAAFGVIGAVILGGACTYAWRWCLRRAGKSQLFQSDTIATAVGAYAELAHLRSRITNLFITTSVGRPYLDPDTDNIRREPGPPATYYTDTDHPPLASEWVSEYHDLCAIDDQARAIELLRRSSALPVVFQQGVTDAGHVVVDGGLVDNVPYLPAALTDAEVFVVVLLSPDATLSAEQIERSLAPQWRRHRMPSLPEAAAVELYRARHNGLVIPDEKWFSGAPTLRGRRVVVIAPAEPLAKWRHFPFLTGTINLSRNWRINWFHRGYEDAMKVLTAASD